jgi:hypothetical protein
MTVFCIEVERDVRVAHFVETTKRNFFFTDFFNGVVREVQCIDFVWYVFYVKVPMPLPFRWLGAGYILSVLLFLGLSWWLVLSLLFLIPEVAESRWYWYARLYLKLRKYGYKGKIRLVGREELVRKVLF